MANLRDYQIRISKDANEILERKKLVCLFMEVRTGKSLTALEICKLSNANKVLFITKIKYKLNYLEKMQMYKTKSLQQLYILIIYVYMMLYDCKYTFNDEIRYI